jgi:hypothetical protein
LPEGAPNNLVQYQLAGRTLTPWSSSCHDGSGSADVEGIEAFAVGPKNISDGVYRRVVFLRLAIHGHQTCAKVPLQENALHKCLDDQFVPVEASHTQHSEQAGTLALLSASTWIVVCKSSKIGKSVCVALVKSFWPLIA